MIMRRFLLLSLGLAAAMPVLAATSAPSAKTKLAPEPRQVLIGRTAVQVAQKRHYPAEDLNPKLAATILDQYFDALDPGRFYFTQQDITRLHNKYDGKLPKDLQHGNLEPAFAIYRLYVRRVRQQVDFALGLMKNKPDFSGDGSYRFERRKAPRAADQDALEKLWREEFDNEALTQMLAGKKWPAVAKVLERRYKQTLRYVDQSTSTDVFSSYMNAYMQALDPHSSYFSPFQEQQFQIQMSLQLQGIGAQLTTRDGYVTIVRILPGGPAAKDGELKPGDRITGVAQGKNGKMLDVVGWRLDDVVKKIRGKKGTTVRLQILPAGALPGSSEKTLTLVRNTIELEAERAHAHTALVRHGTVAYRIGIIDIPSFYANFGSHGDSGSSPTVTSDVRALIKKLKRQKVSGILLDLRGNGGGSLQQAAALTGLFIPDGPVVQVENRGGRIQSLDTPDGQHPVWHGPLGVLINRFSASATEIFAGALKDYHRALVMGSRTWGKGTVQTLVPLSDYLPGFKAGELKLTMAQFFRVSGSSTQHRGVTPDLAIPSAIDDSEFGEDSYPNALPWKSIQAADFKPVNDDVEANLPKLQKYFRDHVQKSDNYRLFERQVGIHRKMAARKTVSLNLAKRKQERTQHRARELAMDNAWRKLAGEPPFKTLEAADSSDFSPPDIALQAGARLLGDYIDLSPSVAVNFGMQFNLGQQTSSPQTSSRCLKELNETPAKSFCAEGGNGGKKDIEPPPASSASGG